MPIDQRIEPTLDEPVPQQQQRRPDEMLRLALERLSERQLEQLREAAAGRAVLQEGEGLSLLLKRLLDLALRVVSLNTLRLPATELEQRLAAAQHLTAQIDQELQRRRVVDAPPAAPLQADAEPAKPPAVDTTTTTTAVEELIVKKTFDARQEPVPGRMQPEQDESQRRRQGQRG